MSALSSSSAFDPLLLGVDWVQAQLNRDPRTRHLHVLVRAQGDTLVLEGEASTMTEKLWAGQLARKCQTRGKLDNRIDVFNGGSSGLSPTSFRFTAVPARQVA